jgi:hypothetical protein
MIESYVASSLWLQLIIKIYKITFNVGISINLVLHYCLNSILETILTYINIPTKQE